MSLPGMIRFRGSVADVYRPATAVEDTTGLTTVTWTGAAPVAGNLRVLLDVVSDELAQRIFGREVSIDLRGIVTPPADVARDDGLVVRTGAYAGERFRVVGHVPSTLLARSAHVELALARTTEVFG